jgi:hypothetical protein
MFVVEDKGAEHHNICRQIFVAEDRGAAHRNITGGKGNDKPFQSPFGDKPFS